MKRRRTSMFDRCVADVTRKGSARNPYAVCASTLKRRRNPKRPGRLPYVPRYNREAVDRAIESASRFQGKIGKRERSLIHRLLKGRHHNPSVRVLRVRRFVLVATRAGERGALIWTGTKLAQRGKPVLFATADSAKLVAKFLRLQFPHLQRYAFYARPT